MSESGEDPAGFLAPSCPGCRTPLHEPPCPECGRPWRWEGGVLDTLAAPPRGFSGERHQRMLGLEERHFWFVGRRRLLEGLVRRFLPPGGWFAELGCGSGWLLRSLHGNGFTLAAVDGHAGGLRELAVDCPGVLSCRASVEATPLPSASFHAVGLFDVLEHVEEGPVLGEARRLLRPGGHLLLSVPAFPFLWSSLDERAGHLRRYTRAGLRRTLETWGFRPVFTTAWLFLLFPLLALHRLLNRSPADWKLPPDPLNALLGAITRAEALVSPRVPLPWGSSWVCAARRS